MKSASPNDVEVIVKSYATFMENSPRGIIHDISLLPHPKNEILNALLVSIGASQDPEYVNALSNAALFLSHFQDGVGESIIPMAIDAGNITKLPHEDRERVIDDLKRFQHFGEIMNAESDETMIEINNMKEINALLYSSRSDKPPMKKKGWRRFFGL
ncbi:hypothetical protein Sj15T_00720 [Sphingobium sp. TA15]|uniref:Uncharacterized protein n=1 Tax=Sphingobium indicum (strain DSM 16413 / CCM 7287 / MTCC 6362 / UT26 / NBRC 101211 / UT26S) TaxID=452662 RepID=D4YZE2_SPHIU|nr:hypothetical protein [Sphingobium indicum]EPR16123.1 hypothetical protein M527_22375 [Sphingobium indicum IP26]BAI95724.1 hypothetical protein SJA_C1-08900 [Sphingobium indicum UT26S]BDD65051.1 hypothetical protein Sj15T_00720 [Sphingobium sp. TA15]